ncbi:MAG: hypothetical protein MZU91_05525 [Desulfosudis oleivorans]|nr:hypothetical protein [Desulfosudis oleivorans]
MIRFITLTELILTGGGTKVDVNYSLKQLESLVKIPAVFRSQNGKTKVDFKTIHLSMRTEFSLEAKQKAKIHTQNQFR